MQFTEKQLEDFRAYEAVRISGRYNMFEPKARKASGLFLDEYVYVMRNYSALREAAEAQQIKSSK